MRVISGKAKGVRLKRVPGDSTRPIMDRVKENLFNILGDVTGERWLDLFAGTGQVGIEALSRGAAEVVFVDKVRTAVRTIEANLAATRLKQGAQVVHGDAFQYLRRRDVAPFHLIYVARRNIWDCGKQSCVSLIRNRPPISPRMESSSCKLIPRNTRKSLSPG
jgi:16S rRNA (guanine966-N2)-methyltransferase